MSLAVAHRIALAAAIALPSFRGGPCAEGDPGTLPPRVVTLDEALASAESVPELIVARANERIATAGIRLAKVPGEPSLTLATHSVSARESVALSIPFRWGGQKASAVSAAEAELQAATRSREAAMAIARHACRVAWFTLASAEDLLRAASESAARSERIRQALADLLEVQRASRLEAARAAADAALTRAARARAEQTVIAASGELRALLGLSGSRLSAGEARPTPPSEGALESWRERARTFSPELAVAQAELKAAESRAERLSRERRPTATLEAGADWNDPTQPGTDASVGLGLTFPTRGHAAWDVALAERDRAAAQYVLASRRVAPDLESAWAAVAAARERFEAVDQVARPAAMEAAELTGVAAREGKLGLFQVLDVERALADAQRDRADAYRDWWLAYADLELLAPEVIP
jgi:outer membrane protein TolC